MKLTEYKERNGADMFSKGFPISLAVILVMIIVIVLLAMSIMETRDNTLKAVRKYDFEFMGNTISAIKTEVDVPTAFTKVSSAFTTQRYTNPFFPVFLISDSSCLSNGHSQAATLCSTTEKNELCATLGCKVNQVTTAPFLGQTWFTYRIDENFVLVGTDLLSTSKIDALVAPFTNISRTIRKILEIRIFLIAFGLLVISAACSILHYWGRFSDEQKIAEELANQKKGLAEKLRATEKELKVLKDSSAVIEENLKARSIELNDLKAQQYDLNNEITTLRADASDDLAAKEAELDSLQSKISTMQMLLNDSNQKQREIQTEFDHKHNSLEQLIAESNATDKTHEEQLNTMREALHRAHEEHERRLKDLKSLWGQCEGKGFSKKRKVETDFIDHEAVFTITQAFLALEQYVNKLLNNECSKDASFADKIVFLGGRGYINPKEQRSLNKFRTARNRWFHALVQPHPDITKELLDFLRENNIGLDML